MRIGRRVRLLAVGVLAVLLAGSMSACEPPPAVQVQPVVTGLDSPVAFTIDPNNVVIWYAERFSGEIRRRNLLDGTDTLVWTVPNIVSTGERGLLGLALHPNFPSTRAVFAYANRSVNNAVRDQVLRIDLNTGFIGTAQTPILDVASPGGGHHVGGRLQAGPDGNLFVAIGEHTDPALAQNLGSTAGKVLRMTTAGGVPAGNPFGNRIYAFGIRNSFGFDFDPANGRLWLTDNGPTCNDEVNRIVSGGNYAWGPNATCATPPPAPENTNQDGPSRQLPQRFYAASQGITGAVFCDDCGIEGLDQRLLVGAVNNGIIRMLTLNGDRTGVSSDPVLIDHDQGVISMETRRGQPVYFSTFTGIFRLMPA